MQSLIPRKTSSANANWQPAILDDPDAAEGLRKVWALALRNAANQQRKNGPTTEDVRAAREEARPQLMAEGLIREAPAAFQQSTAERMAASQARREQVVDVRTPEQEAEAKRRFDDVLKQVRDKAPERERQAKVNAVKEELERPERERQHRLEEKVRDYNRKLIAAYDGIHELLIFLRSVDRIDGTQYLQDMREISVMGLVTVRDDLPRIKGLGEELMEIAQLANSCSAPSGIDMTTLEVEVD